MHERLWQIVRRLNTDYEPFGKAEREGPDCSAGCRHFIKLAGDMGKTGVFAATRNRHGSGWPNNNSCRSRSRTSPNR